VGKLVLGITCGVLAVGSYIAMQVFVSGAADPSHGYFSTVSHFYPLMIGSLGGILFGFNLPYTLHEASHNGKIRAGLYGLLIVCAVIIVVLCRVLAFEDRTSYSLGIVAVAILSFLMIFAVRVLQVVRIIPELKLLKYLGLRSYSIYLFHWPVYIVFARVGEKLSGSIGILKHEWIAALISLAVTLILSHFCYNHVEERFRKGIIPKGFTLRTMHFKLLPSAIAVLLLAFSVVSAATAPGMTDIEENYSHERAKLDVLTMQELGANFGAMDPSPVGGANDRASLPPLPSEAELGIQEGDIGEDYEPPAVGGWQDSAPEVTVIGDSVTLGSASYIKSTIKGAYVDAKVSRNMGTGVEIIQGLIDSGKLGEYVVVALASNANGNTAYYAGEICKMLPPGHRIIFVTGHGKDFMYPENEKIRKLPEKYPFATIADWDKAISPYEDILAPDKIHADNKSSKQLYANVIAIAMKEAAGKPTS
jgi:hypothetical protein